VQANIKDKDGKAVSLSEFFGNKTVVVFGVPGAFTPVCTSKHVPSYVDHAEKLKSKGVDTIACVSVNDPFVMKAWAQSLGSKDVVMLADWDASFSKAVGMDVDLSGASLGKRSKRYSLLVKDGVIVQENVEKSPAEFEVTGADNILKQLDKK